MNLLAALDNDFLRDVEAALRLDSTAARPTPESLRYRVERAQTGREIQAVWRDARELADDGACGHVSEPVEQAEARAAAFLAARLPSGTAGVLVASIALDWPQFQAHLDTMRIEVRRPALAAVAQHADEAARWFAARMRSALEGGER